MATKRRKKRTPAEEAELRISKWKPNNSEISTWGGMSNNFTVQGYRLDLSDLGLKHMPYSLRALPAIELLDLTHNVIEELPTWIGELSALKGLSLFGNNLRTLPEV
jgi:Leucine-rich repeat (LRR) protein